MSSESGTTPLDAMRYETQLVLANSIELGLRVMEDALGEEASSFLHGEEIGRDQRARLLAAKINKYLDEGKVMAVGVNV